MAIDRNSGASKAITIKHIERLLIDKMWVDGFQSKNLATLLYDGGFRVRIYKANEKRIRGLR